MDAQDWINIAFGLVGGLLGYILNGVRESVRDLQVADSSLADKVQRIEVLVAGKYVPRTEFDNALVRIFEKLDSIDHKLDKKADK